MGGGGDDGLGSGNGEASCDNRVGTQPLGAKISRLAASARLDGRVALAVRGRWPSWWRAGVVVRRRSGRRGPRVDHHPRPARLPAGQLADAPADRPRAAQGDALAPGGARLAPGLGRRAGPDRGGVARQRAPLPLPGRRHAADDLDRPERRRRRLLQPPLVRLHRADHRRSHGMGLDAGDPPRRPRSLHPALDAGVRDRRTLRDRVSLPPGRRRLPLAPRPGRADARREPARSSAGSAPAPTSTTRSGSRPNSA